MGCEVYHQLRGLIKAKYGAFFPSMPALTMRVPKHTFSSHKNTGKFDLQCLLPRAQPAGQDACNVGDEGGFAPSISSSEEGLVLVTDAIAKAGCVGKVQIGIDVASSEFFCKDRTYDLNFKVQPNDGSQKRTA